LVFVERRQKAPWVKFSSLTSVGPWPTLQVFTLFFPGNEALRKLRRVFLQQGRQRMRAGELAPKNETNG